MTSLLIWGHADHPPIAHRNVILWRSFTPEGGPSSWISLPTETTVRRETLVSDYRDLMQALGESKVGIEDLTHFTQLRPGLSYWWMSIPSVYSLDVASLPFTLVRIMLLAQIIADKHPETISMVGLPRDVANIFRRWAQARGIKVYADERHSAEPVRLRTRIVKRFPLLAALRVFATHLRVTFRRKANTYIASAESEVTLVDYDVAPVSPQSPAPHTSRFWGFLPTLLSELSITSQSIHMPLSLAKAKGIPTQNYKASLTATGEGRHSHLYSLLGCGVFFRSIQDYFRLRRMGRSLLSNVQTFEDPKSQVSLAEVLRPALMQFFYGRDAALSAFTINLWDCLLSRLPTQRLGLYLYENQPWEFAFQSAWRRHHHGTLVGVPHSTLVAWDLRIFGHEISSRSEMSNVSMPWPDFLAVNGKLMRTSALRGGYPELQLLEVESLRFRPHNSRGRSGKSHVLILAEYSTPYAIRILNEFQDKYIVQDLPVMYKPLSS